jgi:hypothetical protein
VIATRIILMARASVVTAMSMIDRYMLLSLVIFVDGLAVVRRGYGIPEHKKIEEVRVSPHPPILLVMYLEYFELNLRLITVSLCYVRTAVKPCN